jgi:Thioredoxin like C-terminal domain
MSVVGSGVETPADWDHLNSPETYLGFDRLDGSASPENEAQDGQGQYRFPEKLGLNHWVLSGNWTIEAEKVVLHEGGGSIVMQFHARDAPFGASSKSPESIAFQVTIAAEPPGASRGVGIDEGGNGVLGAGRMYQLYVKPA